MLSLFGNSFHLFYYLKKKLSTVLPKDLQLDWEAILESDPAKFEKVIRTSWLDKALSEAKTIKLGNKDSVPVVSEVVKTLRDAMTMINMN